MRPYPDELLRALQAGIMAHFAPEVQSTYGKAQIAFAMLLFGVVQRDYDRAVPDLIDENRRLRGLLDAAAVALAALDGDAVRAARGRIAALPPATPSLRLSDLRAEHALLRSEIAGLAPLIESAADDPSRAPLRDVRASIYAYLIEDAKKRAVPVLGA
ncbi:MAG: hypothetical protein IVW36_09840 [Dehalococcoidia bacterium]|nr:hypothetical protein [Dehalococcoidia bacterium]